MTGDVKAKFLLDFIKHFAATTTFDGGEVLIHSSSSFILDSVEGQFAVAARHFR